MVVVCGAWLYCWTAFPTPSTVTDSVAPAMPTPTVPMSEAGSTKAAAPIRNFLIGFPFDLRTLVLRLHRCAQAKKNPPRSSPDARQDPCIQAGSVTLGRVAWGIQSVSRFFHKCSEPGSDERIQPAWNGRKGEAAEVSLTTVEAAAP